MTFSTHFVSDKLVGSLSMNWRRRKHKSVKCENRKEQLWIQANLVVKRIVDVIGSGLGLFLLLPVFIGISFAIINDSEGPILFRQDRLTKNGKEFKMLKFRSMYMDSEKQGARLFNYKNDPRVTRVGRKLRNTSLDELPQLINVLAGDLSLVGPRPSVSYELGDFKTLNSIYKKRFGMTAGITGLAQTEGRNNISWDEKVHYDNKYIDQFRKYGVLLDVKILFMTFLKVSKSQDIYEKKINETMRVEEVAAAEDAEIDRIAHLSDEEYKKFEKLKYGVKGNEIG